MRSNGNEIVLNHWSETDTRIPLALNHESLSNRHIYESNWNNNTYHICMNVLIGIAEMR